MATIYNYKCFVKPIIAWMEVSIHPEFFWWPVDLRCIFNLKIGDQVSQGAPESPNFLNPPFWIKVQNFQPPPALYQGVQAKQCVSSLIRCVAIFESYKGFWNNICCLKFKKFDCKCLIYLLFILTNEDIKALTFNLVFITVKIIREGKTFTLSPVPMATAKMRE